MPCFIATNSAPKTDYSMVVCFLDSQQTREFLMKIMKPVWDRRLVLFPAWSLPTNARRSTPLSRGLRTLGELPPQPHNKTLAISSQFQICSGQQRDRSGQTKGESYVFASCIPSHAKQPRDVLLEGKQGGTTASRSQLQCQCARS